MDLVRATSDPEIEGVLYEFLPDGFAENEGGQGDIAIDANPFADVKGGSQANESRAFFVTRDMAQAVLDACPDDEWRLIFTLSRFGGLRCPSETLELKWHDVNWAENRIVVRESKTKARTIPLFPEIRPYLDRVFDAAPEGTEHVIQRYRRADCNLRTQLLRIITRASLSAWPRLFHNLRASRETELVREHPIHVVCAWIGNSERVARRHYLQVTDADFEKATSHPTSPMHADGRTGPHVEKETAVKPAITDSTAVHIPPAGVQQTAFSQEYCSETPSAGADSGAEPLTADTAELVRAFDQLAPSERQLVLRLVRSMVSGDG